MSEVPIMMTSRLGVVTRGGSIGHRPEALRAAMPVGHETRYRDTLARSFVWLEASGSDLASCVGVASRGTILVLALLTVGAGCVDFEWQVCGDARRCSPSARCDLVHHVCSSQDETCFERENGTPCVAGGSEGRCEAGKCQVVAAAVCGDGRRDRGEDCEGADLAGATCRSEGFYFDSPGLQCTGCSFDTSGCTGYCGDGQLDEFEDCDPSDPETAFPGFCADLGLSAGRLECLDTCNASIDGCIRFGWTISDPGDGPGNRIFIADIWGAEGQLIAVGSPRKVRWFDGETWRDWQGGYPPGLPPSESPAAIWGASLSDFWIASKSGLAHWDGTDWYFTAYPNDIHALWGSGGNDIFGVGGGGLIHHYDGESWKPTASPAKGQYLNDVSGSGPTDVYAVGGPSALHFDGRAWSSIEVGMDIRHDLRSVWVGAADDVWMILHIPFPPGEVLASLLHFDGVQWRKALIGDPSTVTYPSFELVAGRGRNDIWVAGTGYAWHFDGVGWVKMPVQSRLLDGITGIWVDRASVVFTGPTFVEVWDGAGQLDFSGGPTNVSWSDVWGVSSATWVAVGSVGGRSGTSGTAFFEYDGSVRTLPEPLFRVAGFGRDDVYAMGWGGTIYHFNGEDWADFRGLPRGAVDPSSYRPLYIQAVGTKDLYVLEEIGGKPVLSRFDGLDWSIIPLPDGMSEFFTYSWEMWVFSSDDIWLFKTGEIWHFDGSAWLKTDAYVLSKEGALGSYTLVSAWGSGPDDLFALAWPQTVWHYDGSYWALTEVGLEGSSFAQVRGNAADDVFVLGGSGQIAHFDGREWEPMAPLHIRNPNGHLWSMAVMPGILVAVGEADENGIVEGLLRTRMWNCRTCEDNQANRIDDNCDGQVDEIDIDCQDP